MQTVENPAELDLAGKRCVVTIGAYDGVHQGHRRVISYVRDRAAALSALSVVVTFDRHPASVVRPESAPKLLTDFDQKMELLAATGVDATVVLPFDAERSAEEPAAFVRRVLIEGLRARVVVVGSDFHFGRQRRGDVDLLAKMGLDDDFVVEPLDLVPRADGIDEPVSSTAIRRALAGGEVETATRMLGRPHEVRGTVVPGDNRGRTIGVPTANVEVPNGICLPADGVYAGLHRRPDGSVHPCAVNLGRRPTFYDGAGASLLESHLIDFDGDLYGESAAVEFLAFLRSERKFSGLEELKTQVALDIEHARSAVLRHRRQG